MSTATTNQVPASALAHTPGTPSVWKMLQALAGVATISGVLLALSYQATYSIIEKNKREQLRNAVFDVLPAETESQAAFAVDPASGTMTKLEGEKSTAAVVYAGYDAAGNLTGVAIEGSSVGYGDIVRVLYGYAPGTQTLTGFKVLESKETPGLGDRIGKAPFTDNFNGLDVALTPDRKTLAHPVETVKAGTKTQKWQIDAISGATISSKAVGKAVQTSSDALIPVVYQNIDKLKGQQ